MLWGLSEAHSILVQDFQHLRDAFPVALLLLIDDVLFDKVGQCARRFAFRSIEIVQAIDSVVQNFSSRFGIIEIIVESHETGDLRRSGLCRRHEQEWNPYDAWLDQQFGVTPQVITCLVYFAYDEAFHMDIERRTPSWCYLAPGEVERRLNGSTGISFAVYHFVEIPENESICLQCFSAAPRSLPAIVVWPRVVSSLASAGKLWPMESFHQCHRFSRRFYPEYGEQRHAERREKPVIDWHDPFSTHLSRVDGEQSFVDLNDFLLE